MSRIGKLPITVPEDVTLSQSDNVITVKGPKGEQTVKLHRRISLKQEGQVVTVHRKSDSDGDKALHGLSRTLVSNAITGVTEGFVKTLEIKGVGFRAAVTGGKLVLTIGFSHPVEIEQPEGITLAAKGPKITVSGIDKQYVGEVAAQIRRVRPPDAYKGKGIRYEGEYVRIKAGKAAKSASA